MHPCDFEEWLPLRGRWLRYSAYGIPIALLVWLNVYQDSEWRVSARQSGNVALARVQLNTFKTALTLYQVDHGGAAPSTAAGLAALIRPPRGKAKAARWKGPYLNDVTTVPLDPWDHPYVYQSPGAEGEPFEVSSYGADGKPDGRWHNADLSTSKK